MKKLVLTYTKEKSEGCQERRQSGKSGSIEAQENAQENAEENAGVKG